MDNLHQASLPQPGATPMRIAADCTGKVPFRSRELAMRVSDRARKRKRRSKGEWRPVPYRCPHCRQWHLGRDSF